ncbi:HAD family hydrolase [Salinisphaera sp. T5B8]|uniref:HAD hydrolase-like protein n=1 Tax=unclassified Salinisphaera TaxID=2649847 RepID=UPI003341B9EB
MRHKVLLFDLDGTLTDPREGITRCVQYALSRQGVQVDDLARLECFIGPPLKQSFIEFYGFDAVQAQAAVDDYRVRFGRSGMYENRLYQGIVELLAALKGSGRQLFVATSKPWFYARQIVQHFGLDSYFCSVYGSELDGTRTEKHALIAHILREEKIAAGDALMIGDRSFDLMGARHNGVANAAVGYGYGSRAELEAEAPDYYFPTLADMQRTLLSCRA